MADITALFATTPVPGAIEQSVVDLLEDLLSQAKRGEIVGLAAVWVDPARLVANGWVGVAPTNPMLAGIARLQFNYLLADHEAQV